MLTIEVIGNLGADAHVEESNGRKFVAFNVADSQRWTDQNGQAHESVQWVSCTMDGDGGNLLPHLAKGRLVYVVGRGSTRVYSSPKTRRFEAGINLSVMRIELLGGQPDIVPRDLYDADGIAHRVTKYFSIPPEDAKALGVNTKKDAILQSADGRQFQVVNGGWVAPIQPAETQDTQNAQDNG